MKKVLGYLKFTHISSYDRRYGGGRQETHFGDHQAYEISRSHIVVEIKQVQVRRRRFRLLLFVQKQFTQIAVLIVARKEVLGRTW